MKKLRSSTVTDTSPEASAVLLKLLRSKPAEERLRMVESLNKSVRSMAWAGITAQNEEASQSSLLLQLAERTLGTQLAIQVYQQRQPVTMNDELIQTTLKIIEILDRLKVDYLIGGSLASSVYGEVRSTNDADLVADLKAEHVTPMVEALEPDFYITSDSVREAIRRKSSFNIIHYDSSFKIDIFLPKNRPFDVARFKNRQLLIISSTLQRSAFVSSAEDILLAKLEWYRLGNEVSERQWLDIVGIVRMQTDKLDLDYLQRMAAELNLADLLKDAFDNE